ncbi:MAG: TetR/AcrR family transcriptional regulator, tetracycline repressor protein [Solirubrobacteraceae bacterium]
MAKRRTRRPRGSLSREEIVDKAMAIAMADGLEALTMPRLASDLNVGVMTLYGHVANKEDLLDELSRQALADFALGDFEPDDWPTVLDAYARGMRERLLRYPRLIDLFRARRTWSSSLADAFETMLDVLTRAGWTLQGASHAFHAVQIYALGFVTYEVGRTHDIPYQEHVRRFHITVADYPRESYPLLNEARDIIPTAALEEQFEVGLRAMIDGLRVRLQEQEPQAVSTGPPAQAVAKQL